jgi:hypothetical protein
MIKLHYPEGMKLHGDNACKFHGFEKYNPETDKKEPAMFWLYFDEDYKLLQDHKGKKYIFWHNADVVKLLRMFQKYIPDVRDPKIVHVCHNTLLRDGLVSAGIYSLVRPIFWGDASKYKPNGKPLTKDCYITANKDRGIEYGEMVMNALAWRFPDWNFHIFGIEPTIQVYCDNLKYYGWIPEEEMDEITKNFMIYFRFNQHDGFSQTVMKARMRGQYAITSIEYPICYHYKGFDELCNYFLVDEQVKIIGNDNQIFPVASEYFSNFDFIV